MKIYKKIMLLVVAFIVLLTINCYAVSEGETITYNGITTTMPKINEQDSDEDPEEFTQDNGIMLMSDDAPQSINSLISKFESSISVIGIDVSNHQQSIDWTQVANSGVKFAILRCGYRGQTSGGIYEDGWFRSNATNAINNGIYIGVYFYSMAVTEEEAIQEAATTVNLMKGYDIKYPVYYDFEELGIAGHRAENLTVDQMNKNAQAFLGYIRNNGYQAGLYGSANYMNKYWKMNEFSNTEIWVAHFDVSKPSYTGSYQMWQCTDSGSVPGISGNVDVNVDYADYFKYNNVDISKYMFDAEYYADRYPDLKAAFGYNTALLRNHYELFGKGEGRSATPIFDAKYYVNTYSDLKRAFGTDYTSAYNHFIIYGGREGRRGSKYFDAKHYLQNYQDLKRAFYSSPTKAIEHYALFGVREGRGASSEFNVKSYMNSISSYYRKHIGTNYKKYIALDAGGKPFSDPSVNIAGYMFDYVYYADSNADLKAAFGYNEGLLRNHFELFGKKEGRTASRIFDPKYYLNTYSDLKRAFGTDYASAYNHFVSFGANEGRIGSSNFSAKKYVSNYGDLEAEFGTNYTKAIEHYVLFGSKEGRKGI